MYAIVMIKGKQYRVAIGDVIDVDLLEQQPGEEVEFKEVLLLNDNSLIDIGMPKVMGCSVQGKLLDTSYGPKITSMKYKRRKGQRTKWGHRQRYSRLEITAINKPAQEE